jgi:hypothetical protein
LAYGLGAALVALARSSRPAEAVRLVRANGDPLHRGDVPFGSLVTAFFESDRGRKIVVANEGSLLAYDVSLAHEQCPATLYRVATADFACPSHDSEAVAYRPVVIDADGSGFLWVRYANARVLV